MTQNPMYTQLSIKFGILVRGFRLFRLLLTSQTQKAFEIQKHVVTGDFGEQYKLITERLRQTDLVGFKFLGAVS